MIYDKQAAANIIGCLVKNPSLLSESDKYFLSPLDFQDRIHAIVFSTVYNLYFAGVVVIDILTIEEYLSRYPELYLIYQDKGGPEFALNAVEIAELSNFDFYYDRLKKFTLLQELKNSGFSINEWYAQDMYDIGKRQELEQKLERASIKEIINSVQSKIYEIETSFINKKNFDFQNIHEGMEEMLAKLRIEPAIGLPFSTDIFSTVTFGARSRKYYLISGETGTGKSRSALENMFYLSIPLRWDLKKKKWDKCGSNQKSIFISTELDMEELQLPALAYLTGISEDLIKTFQLSKEEEIRLAEAVKIYEHFKENIYLYHMPDPTIQQLTSNLRKKIIQLGIQNVFFDYIHTSPQLLAEFKYSGLREDVVLNMLSTALKNLANEMDVFVWSGTQVNAGTKDADFADVGNLRGSRAIADKADFVGIIRLVTPDFLKTIQPLIKQFGVRPDAFIDISKNRGSKYKRVRIWRKMDLGSLRSEDLFLTDEYGSLVPLDILIAKPEPLEVDLEGILTNQTEVPKKFIEFQITV